MATFEPSLLFDISAYSPCLYGPEGGNYGLGRVAVGFAQGLSSRFGDALGLCSYSSSAEAPLLLSRDQPALVRHCIEPCATSFEKRMMRWVDPTDENANLRKDTYSKIRRKIWKNCFNDHRWHRNEAVRRIYKNARLVHSELGVPVETRSPKAGRVYTIHDLIGLRDPATPEASRALTASLLNDGFRNGAYFCCDSQYTADDLKDFLGTDSERIQAAPLGLDPQFRPSDDPMALAAWRKKLGLEEGRRYIIANTGEIKRKNLLSIVRTVHQVRESGFKDVMLVFAGVSKALPRQFAEAFGSQLDWERFVKFTGFVSDEDFRVLYSGAELMLFLSLAEGFGLPPLEAMGCGAPVVCSNKTSLPEVVESAGIMVDPNDSDAVVSAVISVLEKPGIRNDLVIRSLKRAAELNWESTSLHLQRIWNLALS